tara:strand:- start:1706 stop:2875 length:1170 start_codon:yes stop_codon:yes gene_type:complete
VLTGDIPLSVPELGGNEWKYVKEGIDSGWVSSVGPFVTRFETELAQYVGSRHAVAMVNGTAALHIALQVIGVEPNDEVLVSNLTFIAPVNAIRYCQAHPVLMDVHPETWQMDSSKVAKFLEEGCEVRGAQCFNRSTGRRVRAILPVHILGLSCEIDRIVEVARRHHLYVVEDAAEGMGVRYRRQHVGTFGDVGVFSFNGNKIMTAGGGGMLVTDDAEKAECARYLSTQAKDDPIESVHNCIGYNYRLSNVQACIGVAQLEQLDTFITKKRAIAKTYETAFRDLPQVCVMPCPPETEPTCWLYTILLGEKMRLGDRKVVIQDLRRRGVGARPLWHTIHNLRPYRDCYAYRIEYSMALYERGISLPSSVGLSQNDLNVCVEAVQDAVRGLA